MCKFVQSDVKRSVSLVVGHDVLHVGLPRFIINRLGYVPVFVQPLVEVELIVSYSDVQTCRYQQNTIDSNNHHVIHSRDL